MLYAVLNARKVHLVNRIEHHNFEFNRISSSYTMQWETVYRMPIFNPDIKFFVGAIIKICNTVYLIDVIWNYEIESNRQPDRHNMQRTPMIHLAKLLCCVAVLFSLTVIFGFTSMSIDRYSSEFGFRTSHSHTVNNGMAAAIVRPPRPRGRTIVFVHRIISDKQIKFHESSALRRTFGMHVIRSMMRRIVYKVNK